MRKVRATLSPLFLCTAHTLKSTGYTAAPAPPIPGLSDIPYHPNTPKMSEFED